MRHWLLQDSITPGLLTIGCTLFSLAGNLLFVGLLGQGLQGAAVTTVATQWLGAAVLVIALKHRGQVSKVATHMLLASAQQG